MTQEIYFCFFAPGCVSWRCGFGDAEFARLLSEAKGPGNSVRVFEADCKWLFVIKLTVGVTQEVFLLPGRS